MSIELKDVEEGNKLIAEFMGYKPMEYNQPIGTVWEIKEEGMQRRHPSPSGKPIDANLSYHSDWSWLMPVVEKIESLFDNSITVQIYDQRCIIDLSTQYAIAKDFHLPDQFYNNKGPKITSTWLSIIDFIKWYIQYSSEMDGRKVK